MTTEGIFPLLRSLAAAEIARALGPSDGDLPPPPPPQAQAPVRGASPADAARAAALTVQTPTLVDADSFARVPPMRDAGGANWLSILTPPTLAPKSGAEMLDSTALRHALTAGQATGQSAGQANPAPAAQPPQAGTLAAPVPSATGAATAEAGQGPLVQTALQEAASLAIGAGLAKPALGQNPAQQLAASGNAGAARGEMADPATAAANPAGAAKAVTQTQAATAAAMLGQVVAALSTAANDSTQSAVQSGMGNQGAADRGAQGTNALPNAAQNPPLSAGLGAAQGALLGGPAADALLARLADSDAARAALQSLGAEIAAQGGAARPMAETATALRTVLAAALSDALASGGFPLTADTRGGNAASLVIFNAAMIPRWPPAFAAQGAIDGEKGIQAAGAQLAHMSPEEAAEYLAKMAASFGFLLTVKKRLSKTLKEEKETILGIFPSSRWLLTVWSRGCRWRSI